MGDRSALEERFQAMFTDRGRPLTSNDLRKLMDINDHLTKSDKVKRDILARYEQLEAGNRTKLNEITDLMIRIDDLGRQLADERSRSCLIDDMEQTIKDLRASLAEARRLKDRTERDKSHAINQVTKLKFFPPQNTVNHGQKEVASQKSGNNDRDPDIATLRAAITAAVQERDREADAARTLRSENEMLKAQKEEDGEAEMVKYLLVIVTEMLHHMWQWASEMHFADPHPEDGQSFKDLDEPKRQIILDHLKNVRDEVDGPVTGTIKTYLVVRSLGRKLTDSGRTGWEYVFDEEKSLSTQGVEAEHWPPWLVDVMGKHKAAHEMDLEKLIGHVQLVLGVLPPAVVKDIIKKLEDLDQKEQTGVEVEG